jgi:endo-1,4-beta-D-glucanase Y
MSSDGKTRFAMAALAPGVRLNDTYEIDAHIASGGMGEVYRGHNIETGEPVAIKTMLPELARDEAIFALFKKEATLLGRLRHDTIVHYYSFSRDPAIGQPYLAMEFVEGRPLSEKIAAGPLGAREAATLFIRIADGLAVAHEAGIIHRDLSPDNVILRGSDVRHPRIIDFGIARSVQGGDKTLIGSNFAGKFDFVSPEQLGMAGGEVTQRSDIYSLGLVMAAALSGKALDMGGTHLAVIEKRRVVPDLTGLDAGLLPLVAKMLAPDPADRPPDMTEVADWLRAYLAGQPATHRPGADQPSDRPVAAFESPFGPGPMSAAPFQPVGTGPAVASAAGQPPRRRVGAALAASLVAVLAIGGAAYLGGLFDDDGEDKIVATEPVSPSTDAAAPAAPETPQPSGADGKAAERLPAGPETATAPDTTVKPAGPETAAAPQAGTAADTPVEPKPDVAATAAQPEQPAAGDTPAAPGDGARTTEPAATSPAAPDPAATAPAGNETAVNDAAGTAPADAASTETAAAAGTTDPVAPAAPAALPVEQGAAAPAYGDCFFATVAEAARDTLALRGFAPSPALVETIGKTVVDAGASPPLVDAPVVTAKQCAVVDFLKAMHPRAEDGARLILSSATPRIGSTLTATVSGADGRPVRLLAVDGDGAVRLLGAASKADPAGSATVSARLDPASFGGEAEQIVIAIVGDVPLAVPEGAAAAYFPGVADALMNSTEKFGIDFAHFRPSMAGEALTFAPQPYTEGTIRPNHLSQDELDRALIDFYKEWKGLYVVQDCGEGRYLLKVNADGKAMEGGSAPGSITVSEAHGYGMLALALMAGADADAQAAFDGMHRYRVDHPARSSPHLMAWNQVEGCRNAGEEVGGDNTATDGDLDIAYALLLADKAWGSAGGIDYRAAALATIGAILEHEVSAAGDFLMLGDWAATSDEKRFRTATRTSDFMLSHLKAFADASGDARWLAVRDRAYAIIETITRKFSARTALMPDFIVDAGKAPKPAPANFMEGESDGDFSWNAARYPWRVGLDYLLHGEARAQAALAGLNKWVRREVKDDPTLIADTYRLNGSALPGAGTGSLTFVSLMGVAAMIEADNQAWLNAIWDHVVAQKLEDDDFYGNTLKLMAMIAMSGHWAKP